LLGFRQRSLHAWPRRLRATALARFGNRPPRTQRVYLVTVGGTRCKRIVFPDSHHASMAAARLQAFAHEAIYPGVILERERELWVEYVEGDRVQRVDGTLIEAMAKLLSVLMKRAPRRVPLRETPWLTDLERDLGFLARAGVLDAGASARLVEKARASAPASVWVGHDCTDAILKNFVWTPEGRLRAVDVESLGADQLIGVGAAKAATRWLGEHREDFLENLKQLGSPDFESYFDFVELSFRAFWQKSSLLEKKHRFVDPRIFARFLETT
jgi:hypothetical protein